MWIHVNYSSGEPIIRQAVDQIQLQVVNGTLRAGDKLPSIRELAKNLQINPTTVQRIYSELAHAGTIVLRRGQGAFVADRAVRLAPEEVKRIVEKHARTLLVEGLRLGMDYDQIREVVERTYSEIREGKGDNE